MYTKQMSDKIYITQCVMRIICLVNKVNATKASGEVIVCHSTVVLKVISAMRFDEQFHFFAFTNVREKVYF